MRIPLLPLALLLACGAPPEPPAPTPAPVVAEGPTPLPARDDLSDAAKAQRLLSLGIAHLDMRAWDDAAVALQQLLSASPEEPAALYGIAVVEFHRGNHDAATARLTALGDALPSEAAFLRSRVAYEAGDVKAQLHHLMRASASDRGNGAYALAVGQLGQGTADPKILEIHFRRALAALPGNARVEAEFARWAVKRPEPALKADGEALIKSLARWVEGDVPENTTGMLNALRGSRRYRLDAATVDAAGALEPIRHLASVVATPAPERPVTFQPEPWPHAAGDGPITHAVPVDDMSDAVTTAMPRPGIAYLRGGTLSFSPQINEAATPIGSFKTATHLLAFDADADAALELLVADAAGVHVLDRADTTWTPTTLAMPAAPRDVLVVDIESDHDHDLLVVDATGATWLSTNADGFGPLEPWPIPVDGLDVLRIVALDIDRDHDLDLAVYHRTGAVLLNNLRQGTFVAAGATSTAATAPRGDFDLNGVTDTLPILDHPGAAPADVDGDGDLDLIGLGDGAPTLYRNGLAPTPRLSVSIRQPQAKGPSDMRGVVVDVVHGTRTDQLFPVSSNLTIGFGDRPTMVKATWPNGISQYLLDPEAGRHYDMLIPTKLEGSCPFLYAWDGTTHRFVTDLLGVSPVGLALAPGIYAPADPDEYLRLPDWMVPRDGHVDLRFTEELREVTYLDAFELIAVQHPAGTVAHSYEKWTFPFVDGFDLRFTGPPHAPVAVWDDGGADVTDMVRAADHTYLGGPTPRPRYQGVLEPWTTTIQLPANVAAAEDPVLLLTGWLQWGNTSTNIARAQAGERPMFPVLEVPRGDEWVAADVNVGLPAGKTKPVFVSLKGALNVEDPRVRITTDFAVYWDQISVAVAQSPEAVTTRISASEARLQPGGFSQMRRPAANGPFLFDYSVRTPYPTRPTPDGEHRPVSWTPLQGLRTAFGPVEGLLASVDDRSVVFGDGEELALRFPVARVPPAGELETTWFILSHGWAKDGDPNVAFSQTSEPLAWSGMTADPYSDPGPGPEVMQDLEVSLTRAVGAQILHERVHR